MQIRFQKAFAAACLATGLLAGANASAVSWPERPITLVVPFAPGGSTDTTARLLAAGLTEVLGKPVVVDNRGGAGGNIGASLVAQAKADGYTYLFATNAHAAATKLYRRLSYDLKRDFVPVAQVVSFPSVVVVQTDFPARSLQEFVDYVAQKKGPVNYGSAGNGSSHHLTTSLMNRMIKGEMVHIPFKGGGPAAVALLGGQVQMNIAPLIEAMPYISSGQLRPLGVTTAEPAPLYPDVPPIASVLPGYEVQMWSGVLAPTGTSPEIIEQMNAAIRQVLHEPQVAQKLEGMGYRIFDEPVGTLKAIYDTEIERWSQLVELSGAEIN